MIIWCATVATPQFDDILETLYRDKGVEIFVHYLHKGTRGREWGQLSMKYPHVFIAGHGRFCRFLRGLRVALDRRVTTVVAFGYSDPFAIGLLIASRIRRLPVFTQSDSDYHRYSTRSPLRRAFKQAALRGLYSTKTRVWAIGPSNAKYWASFGLRNQIRVPFESPVPAPDDRRSPAAVRPGLRQILYVGRISPEKGIRDAVAAVGRLYRDGERVILRIVGQAPPTADLHQLTGETGPWVQLVGPIAHDDLGVEYVNADVLVLPTPVEAYGLVVREALQFGLPVVATSGVPAARELCDQGWNVVPPNNPVLLAAAIRRALLEDRWPPRPPISTSELYFLELRTVGG